MSLLFLVIIFATIHQGLLLKCYICDSRTNKNCAIIPKEMELMDCSIDIIPKTYSFILPSQFDQIDNHSNKSDSQEDIIFSITKNLILKDDEFIPKACIKFTDKIYKFRVWGCIFRKDIESMCSHTDHNYSCQSCINADGCNL
ncbi:uncharacterized protein LOC122852419 [Aphidius gifuensis]|uniref:uncharacterized protein LOC122852419 n=1 Tax=Aphidius gifuensis TaxID=684658 RepID=UPI001CDC6E0A|nr:uncharacterized protein LOC122852419 [Aphidius gifuensis]